MNRNWIRAAAVLLLTGAIAACGTDAPSSPDGVTEVRVAIIPLGSTLPVHVAEDPLSAVAEGTGKCLNEIKFLRQVATADRQWRQ